MCVFKNGTFYHYEFILDGRRHRGSTGTASKPHAIAEERRQRERLEKSYSQVIEGEAREQRRKTIQQAADEFLLDYKMKHESATFAVYALGLVMKWTIASGGLAGIAHANQRKADKLYAEIDRTGFYRGTARTEDRSLMNVTFRLPSEELEKKFSAQATAQGFSFGGVNSVEEFLSMAR